MGDPRTSRDEDAYPYGLTPLKVTRLIWPLDSLRDPEKGTRKSKGATLRVQGSTPRRARGPKHGLKCPIVLAHAGDPFTCSTYCPLIKSRLGWHLLQMLALVLCDICGYFKAWFALCFYSLSMERSFGVRSGTLYASARVRLRVKTWQLLASSGYENSAA